MYIIRFAPVFLFCFGLSFLQHLLSFLVCFPSRSPSPLPSMLFLFSPLFSISTLYLFFSSAMFLTSWCLTYFLRLLQYSPPLYHESTHIHTHWGSQTPSTLPHPVSTPTLPSQWSGIVPVGPAQDVPLLAEHQKVFTSTNHNNEESFTLKCCAHFLFVFVSTVLFILYDVRHYWCKDYNNS